MSDEPRRRLAGAGVSGRARKRRSDVASRRMIRRMAGEALHPRIVAGGECFAERSRITSAFASAGSGIEIDSMQSAISGQEAQSFALPSSGQHGMSAAIACLSHRLHLTVHRVHVARDGSMRFGKRRRRKRRGQQSRRHGERDDQFEQPPQSHGVLFSRLTAIGKRGLLTRRANQFDQIGRALALISANNCPRLSSPGLTGRPSIPETAVIETIGRGVLVRPVKPGDDDLSEWRAMRPFTPVPPRLTACLRPDFLPRIPLW